jgi:carboxypeptidase C (cathepsin A)
MRVTASRFRKELLRDKGLVLGRLDMRYTGHDIDGVNDEPDSDPMFSAVGSAYNAGFRTYIHGELGLDLVEREYNVSASGAYGEWNRSRAGQEAFAGWLDTVPALAGAMRDNPALRVFCANGWYDVATTVHAAEYNLSRPGIDAQRVQIENYEAGHMMYVNHESLEQLSLDLRAFYEGR